MKIRGRLRKLPATAAVNALLIAVSVVIVYPFVWMIVASLRASVSEIWTTELLRTVIPTSISFESYRELADLGAEAFFLWTKNSLIFGGGSTLVNMIVCTMAAYALSDRELPLGRAFLMFFLAMMVIPNELVAIPLFLVTDSLQLLNTHVGVILPMAAEGFSILLLHRFFTEMPREILEAARIDGASEWGVLARIVLPLSRPVIGTVLLRQFIMGWNAFTLPLILGQANRLRNLQVAMAYFNNEFNVDFRAIMAVGSIITVPVLIIFILTQRTLIRGLTAGALKG